jgi:CDP-diacylglycerol--glycerol-3-phosphate 3-phosphatidyltransferase
MLTLSNFLSLVRGPLAFLFLIENTALRIGAIILAMLTDSLDGYLARRYRTATRFGAILDPLMDKFFVVFILSILLSENRLQIWEGCAMISRDFFLIFFGIYLGLSGHWNAYQCKSIRWGKISTALQFFVLIGLTLQFPFPWYTYGVFILFGTLAFIELCQIKKTAIAQQTLTEKQ